MYFQLLLLSKLWN